MEEPREGEKQKVMFFTWRQQLSRKTVHPHTLKQVIKNDNKKIQALIIQSPQLIFSFPSIFWRKAVFNIHYVPHQVWTPLGWTTASRSLCSLTSTRCLVRFIDFDCWRLQRYKNSQSYYRIGMIFNYMSLSYVIFIQDKAGHVNYLSLWVSVDESLLYVPCYWKENFLHI